ncbi:sensor histidine kinase [Achromobacter insuavis]
MSQTQRNTLLVALLVGALAMVGICAGLLGVVQRDPVFLLLSAAIFVEILYSLSFQGLLYRYVLTGGGEMALRAPSVLATLAASLFAFMAMLFADLHRVRLWRRVYLSLIAAGVAGTVWAALGDYREAAQALIGLIFLWALVWLVSMADGWRRGHANARTFLLSFAVYCACLFLRVAYIHGLLPGRWEGGPEVAWDLLSISLMLAVLLYGRSRQHRQERLAAQRELALAREREHQRLDQAVTERTQALQAALILADEAGRVRQDFLARISHDLRTPLTSIIGFADLIQAGGRDDAPRGAVIRRSADHMLGMVNDLIDYAAGAGGQALRLAPEYAHALLDTVAKESAPIAARQDNRFELRVADTVPAVLEMDGKRVRQVLSNLIDNAAKFTRDGVLTLTADYAAPAPGENAGWLTLSVADSGCGIAPEDRQHIFEPLPAAVGRREPARRRPAWPSCSNGCSACTAASRSTAKWARAPRSAWRCRSGRWTSRVCRITTSPPRRTSCRCWTAPGGASGWPRTRRKSANSWSRNWPAWASRSTARPTACACWRASRPMRRAAPT